jgi:chitodextrinase
MRRSIIHSYAASLAAAFIVAGCTSHVAGGEITGETSQALTCVAPGTQASAWSAGTAYAAGALVTFNGVLWQALLGHTSQVGWEPPNAPSLWARPTPCEVLPWTTRTIYQAGSRVTFNGQLFLCLQGHISQTGWEPANVPSLWRAVALDQSFTTPTNLGSNINEGFRFIAQTYTAGANGVLRGVAIEVFSNSSFTLHVAVRDTTAGSPNDVILADTRLAAGGATLNDVIALPVAVQQVAGHRYAIVVDYPDAPPPGPNQLQGNWLGATGNVYPRGGNMASNDGRTWTSFEGNGFDVHFQTYVSPN